MGRAAVGKLCIARATEPPWDEIPRLIQRRRMKSGFKTMGLVSFIHVGSE